MSDRGKMTASMNGTDQFEDIQEEHRKILETIENALHKLNTVNFDFCFLKLLLFYWPLEASLRF